MDRGAQQQTFRKDTLTRSEAPENPAKRMCLLSFLFNSTSTTCSLKVCSQTCFQCCLKLHKQRKTAGLGQVDSKLGWPRPLRPALPLPPAPAGGLSPGGAPAALPPAGRTPTGRPPRSHRLACRTPARGPRLSTLQGRRVDTGRLGSGPGAHAIGRGRTNEVSAARRPHPRTLSRSSGLRTASRKPGAF